MRLLSGLAITSGLAMLLASTAADAACPHAYMPLRQGATWTYHTDGPDPRRKITLTVHVDSVKTTNGVDVAEVTARWSILTPSGNDQTLGQHQQTIVCDNDGMHTSPPPGTPQCPPGRNCGSVDDLAAAAAAATPTAGAARRSGPQGPKTGKMEVLGRSGVALPSPELMRTGYAWSESFSLNIPPPAELLEGGALSKQAPAASPTRSRDGKPLGPTNDEPGSDPTRIAGVTGPAGPTAQGPAMPGVTGSTGPGPGMTGAGSPAAGRKNGAGGTASPLVPSAQRPLALGRASREKKLKVEGTETLQTALGKLDAIRVSSDETVVLPFKNGPASSRHTETWYARGVGMVKFKDGPHLTELVKFSPGG